MSHSTKITEPKGVSLAKGGFYLNCIFTIAFVAGAMIAGRYPWFTETTMWSLYAFACTLIGNIVHHGVHLNERISYEYKLAALVSTVDRLGELTNAVLNDIHPYEDEQRRICIGYTVTPQRFMCDYNSLSQAMYEIFQVEDVQKPPLNDPKGPVPPAVHTQGA
jgi:hypothetical protein